MNLSDLKEHFRKLFLKEKISFHDENKSETPLGFFHFFDLEIKNTSKFYLVSGKIVLKTSLSDTKNTDGFSFLEKLDALSGFENKMTLKLDEKKNNISFYYIFKDHPILKNANNKKLTQIEKQIRF